VRHDSLQTGLTTARALLEQARFAEAEATTRRLLAGIGMSSHSDSIQVADILDLLVGSLWRGGKAGEPESKGLAERAVAIREKAQGANHPDLARSLGDGLAALLFHAGDYAAAKPLYERALAIQEKALGPDHLDVARSLDGLGNVLYSTSDYVGAKPLHERALAIREKALGSDHPDVATSLNDLGVLLYVAGDYIEAKPLFERALAIREKAFGPENADVARSLSNLGMLLDVMGDYAGAVPLYERALAILERALGPNHFAVAQCLDNLAVLLEGMGDYAGEKPLLERAVGIDEKVLGPEHPGLASDLNSLGSLLSNLGDYVGARPLYERALAIREKVLGPEHPDVAECLSNLAKLFSSLGDDAGARPLLERALAIREKALGPEHPDVGNDLAALAWVLQASGDHAGSVRLYERALAILEKGLGPDHPNVASTVTDLAMLLQSTGDYSGARPLCERALTISEKVFGPDHLIVARSLKTFAELLRETGDLDGALAAALRVEKIGREHLRLTAHALSERQALGYASVRVSGLDVALSLADGLRAPDSRRKLLDALIRSRALVLDEMAARHHAISGTRDPELAQLATRLVSASGRYANLLVRGPDVEHPERYRGVLEQARQEREQAEQALAEKSIVFRREQAKSQIGLDEVATALSPGSALVSFVRYDREDQTRSRTVPAGRDSARVSQPAPARDVVASYAAFVVVASERTPTAVMLGNAAGIDSLVARWSEEAGRGLSISGRSLRQCEEAYRSAGEALRRKIWDPLSSSLQGANRVFAVPDGALNFVNFCALPVGDSGYLVESGPLIHYLSAERDLVPSEAAPVAGQGLLALGGPAFDEGSSLAVVSSAEIGAAKQRPQSSPAAESHYRGERSGCGEFHDLKFASLPASLNEVKEISSLWKKGRAGGESGLASRSGVDRARDPMVLQLTGASASETAFKDLSPGRRVLHLATHAFFLGGRCPSALESRRGIGGLQATEPSHPPAVTGDNPLLLSGLALAGANKRDEAGREEDDGILTAEEIAALDLSGVEWAVLSACDTGVGEVKAGEGVLGLRRAFQVAGAGTLIMSLWSVEDESARRWMRALYEGRLLKHLDTAQAVRAASLQVLQERRRRHESTHPFYWAGFVAAGDWR
jgi:tetratricopeptide (TPR) repeat protein